MMEAERRERRRTMAEVRTYADVPSADGPWD